ncbi:MAG: hypothetical protein HYV13_00785 [Candidatus Doudnabacteria bacterium]|nr:hypothetical protein [Candidatus Doudnabacteria bacterium]
MLYPRLIFAIHFTLADYAAWQKITLSDMTKLVERLASTLEQSYNGATKKPPKNAKATIKRVLVEYTLRDTCRAQTRRRARMGAGRRKRALTGGASRINLPEMTTLVESLTGAVDKVYALEAGTHSKVERPAAREAKSLSGLSAADILAHLDFVHTYFD